MMKISVITVTYNAIEALRQTAQSVLNQDYAEVEYIIVDGNSTDGTKAWLETLDRDHLQWVSEPDGGIYDAMNKGVGMATGEYCLFMNAGDAFVNNQVVSMMMAHLQTGSPQVDVLYGDILKNGTLKESLSPRNCHKMFYCHQAVFTRTECLQAFPFDIQHRYSADFKQAKQLFLAGKSFKHIPLAVAHFDTNGVSNVHRSRGLWDNIRVVCEVDNLADKCRFLPHLIFPFLMCKLRGK